MASSKVVAAGGVAPCRAVAIDQLTADCLALSCAFVGSHRSGHDDPGMSFAQAAALNRASTGHLQHLVNELHRTEPRPERTYELRNTSMSAWGGASHCVLLCTDLRVVYAEASTKDGVRMLVVFPHGALDVQNKLMKLTPELHVGPPAVLIWPRLAGDDDIMDIGVRQVMGEPSPQLRKLIERLYGGRRPGIELVAPYLPAGPTPPPAPASAAPPGWYPDPAGRHQHRWWDGTTWTPNAADAGVPVHDPL